MHSTPRRITAVALAVVLGVLVAGVSPAAAAPAAVSAPTVDRLGGSDVYAVAVTASRLAHPTDGTGTTVVITSGTNFLAGVLSGAAAASLDGTLLLTGPKALGASTKAELLRLAPERIVLVGGTTTVTAGVEAELRAIQPNFERVAGVDFYATSVLLAKYVHGAGAEHVVIAGGASDPATLSAGVLAGSEHAPIVLVRATDAAVRADLAGLFAAGATSRVTIIGEAAAISAKFATAVAARGISVTRVRGANFSTLSFAIAARFPATDRLFISSGSGYGVGVSAIPIAAAAGAPVVYTASYCAVPALVSYAATKAPARVTLVGSVLQVRSLVGSLAACQSTTSASSYWVVANKKNKLNPVSYVPTDLRLPAVQRTGAHQLRNSPAVQLERLNAASIAAGAGRVGLASGYRSYSTQKALYARYVSTRGQAWADSQSARAGFSEHQTGLAADVVACTASACGSIYNFAATKQGVWVKANAWRYGFVVRYESGYTSTTGYASEPWHLRYVGVAVATDYKASGFHTLENYFGYRAAPTY